MSGRGLAAAGVALLPGATACSTDSPDPAVRGADMTSTPPSVAPVVGSVDAGFAYDMSRHHSQAVELAELATQRTTDPAVRTLARDVALTQQSQVGQMRGWLDAWGLPATTTEEPMAWMGMAGQMPGLASVDEVDALTASSGTDADRLFLELLFRHHQGGIEMAAVAADEATEPYVAALAESMVAAQTAEIEAMVAMSENLDTE